jgi:peptidylprolyl isomerase
MRSLVFFLIAGVAASTPAERGRLFLEENKKDPAVTTLPSGLQYKVIEAAHPHAKSPHLQSKVIVHYNGSHISGRMFESTAWPKENDPRTNQPKLVYLDDKTVIQGLRDALLLMKEGDIWNVTLPAELAFGERGSQSRRVSPGVAVNYQIELVAVHEKAQFEFYGIDFGARDTHMLLTTMIFYCYMLYHTFGNPFSNAYDLEDAKSEEHPCIFLEVQIGDEEPGRIEVELFRKLCPKAVENFRALCTGEKGQGKAGKPLHFKGSKFHRVLPGSLIQAGDITKGDGTGGESIYGPTFKDEWGGWLRHKEKYLVSMANSGKNTNNSQFFITTASLPSFDGKNVVVGQVFKGEDVVAAVEAVGSADGTTSKPVTIVNCGMYLRPKKPKDADKKEEEKKKEEEEKKAVEDTKKDS